MMRFGGFHMHIFFIYSLLLLLFFLPCWFTRFGSALHTSHIVWRAPNCIPHHLAGGTQPVLCRLSTGLSVAWLLCHSSFHITEDHARSNVSSDFEFIGCYDSWLKMNLLFGKNKKLGCFFFFFNHNYLHSLTIIDYQETRILFCLTATEKPLDVSMQLLWKTNLANKWQSTNIFHSNCSYQLPHCLRTI